MKILFNVSTGLPVHGKILKERPLGGTETAVIRISEALARLGQEVYIRSSLKEIPFGADFVSGVRYLPASVDIDLRQFAIMVLVQDWRPLIYIPPSLPVFLWTGDGYEQNSNLGIGDRRISGRLAGLLAVSHWHAETLGNASLFPKEKIYVLGNGVAEDFFDVQKGKKSTRVKTRLIYHSAPYRGLSDVLSYFALLQKKLAKGARKPELHVYSDMELYRRSDTYHGPHQNVLRELKMRAGQLSNVSFFPSVPHQELATALKSASIFPYPCNVPETFCMSLAEAMAAGVVPVVSSRGALAEVLACPELIVDASLPKTEFHEKFVAILEKLLTNESFRAKQSKKVRERARALYTWDIMASRFMQIITDHLPNVKK